VRYSQNARVIELQRGEIHIDVAHDKSRPLSVIAGGKVIQAVGTAFNVEVRSELVELIVTEGKVLVAKAKIALLPSTFDKMPVRLPQNSMAISKGEKVDLDLTGKRQEEVTKVDPIEIAASLSWRQGNLIFRGESLSEAMTEISRYTDIEFELADDEKLRKIQVAGLFKTGDVIGLLDALSSNFNINYENIGNNKVALSYAE
jgi:transmembrane sensor